MNSHWIPSSRIAPLIGLESFVLLSFLTLAAYLIYRFFLKEISLKRHTKMKWRFQVLGAILAANAITSVLFWSLRNLESEWVSWPVVAAYAALAALVTFALAVIRVAQAYVYLLLFLRNLRTGVPKLIANIFTLIFSTLIVVWLGSEVFNLEIAPILATSAIFSVVLGLAMQDTLGNFFSGVALQVDHSFGIGDWIEVQNGDQKWVGQVTEITWRATALAGFSDEIVWIPNRTLSQSQVMLFTQLGMPARRNQVFRFPLETPIEIARTALLSALRDTPQVLQDPTPRVIVIETTDSWITMKSFYSIEDFGSQYRIGDQVITKSLAAIRESGLRLASPTMTLLPRGRE